MTPQEQLMVEAARRGLLRPQQAASPQTPDAGTIGDASRGMVSGMTFGLGDELVAGLATPYEMAKGAISGQDSGGLIDRAGAAYSRGLDRMRGLDKQARERSPVATTVGDVAGSLATAGGLSKAGVSLLKGAAPTYSSMIPRAAAEGAAYGATHGFGRGEGTQDRLEKSLYQGALGAVTGGATGAVGAKMAQSVARKAIPSTEQLKQMGSAAYKAAEDAGVVVHKGIMADAIDDIAAAAGKAGIDRTIHPKASAALARLMEAKGTEPSLSQIDQLRRILKGAASSIEPDERRVASIMIDKLDDFVSGLSVKDVVSGDVLKATSSLNQGRDLWSRMRKGEMVDELVERAKNAAPNFSASGYENALRTQFRALAQNKARMRVFTEAEREAIQKIARGGPLDNALRFIGRFAPRGVVSSGFHLGATAMDPTLGVSSMLLGEGARRGATAMTRGNVDALSALVRAGGSMPPPPLTPVQQAVMRGLLTAEQELPMLPQFSRAR
jgi:hypothetical protein